MLERARKLFSAAAHEALRAAHLQRSARRNQLPGFFNFLGIDKDTARQNQGVGFLTTFNKSALNK